MRRIPSLAFAIAFVAASSLAALAQGWGPVVGPGAAWAPALTEKIRLSAAYQKNAEKHAACWSKANDSGVRGAARRSFMTECMNK